MKLRDVKKNLNCIARIANILMNEPWRVLDNPFPPAVLNHCGKALDLNELRVEGLGDEARALEEYDAAMRLLRATERRKLGE